MIALVAATACVCQIREIFANPERACGLLEPEGFPRGEWSGRSWGFQCISPIRSVPTFRKPGVVDIPTTDPLDDLPAGSITYIVSGDKPDRVRRLKLVAELDSKDAGALVAEFECLASVLLSRLGLEFPDALREAISSERQFRGAQPGANITFDPSSSPIWVLTVRDSNVRVVPIPKVRVQ